MSKESECFALGDRESTVRLLRETNGNGRTAPALPSQSSSVGITTAGINTVGIGSSPGAISIPKGFSIPTEAASNTVLLFARSHGYALNRKLKLETEYPVWAMRLDIEEGRRQPAVVNAAPLEADVPQFVGQYWRGFVFQFAVRWSHPPYRGNSAPFVNAARATGEKGFAPCWCGLSEWQAKEARPQLERLGLMKRVPSHSLPYPLWLPRLVGE
jgi:hypothetical protein